MLDEEIARLTEKHRAPLVLCYLEGKSHDQAARELGWPKSSLERRLTRAREMLRDRLERRGLALSGAALVGALTPNAGSAAMPALRSAMPSSSRATAKQSASASASAVLTRP